MVTICRTCGDEGFDVALIYCYDCEEFAVHRYCLEVLPKTFEEYVVWFCDDCKPLGFKLYGNAESCPPSHGSNSRDRISVTSTPPEDNGSQNLKTARLTGPSGRYKRKRMRKLKRKKRKNKEQNGLNEEKDSSCSTAKTDAMITESNQMPQASCSGKDISSQTGNDLPLTVEDEKDTFEETENELPINVEGEKSTFAEMANVLPPNLEDGKSAFEGAESDNKLSPLPALDSSRTPSEVDYVPALPIIDPIWRGGLQVCKYRVRIVAHLSRLACSRVSEEAMLFPEMLSAELNRRATVWPKGFEQCGPRDENIALYFFPESESDEKIFKGLISEMIRTDLALRAVVAHAELLVFTSTKLPLRLWRFQGKLYLWGVFRKKQDTSETPKILGFFC